VSFYFDHSFFTNLFHKGCVVTTEPVDHADNDILDLTVIFAQAFLRRLGKNKNDIISKN